MSSITANQTQTLRAADRASKLSVQQARWKAGAMKRLIGDLQECPLRCVHHRLGAMCWWSRYTSRLDFYCCVFILIYNVTHISFLPDLYTKSRCHLVSINIRYILVPRSVCEFIIVPCWIFHRSICSSWQQLVPSTSRSGSRSQGLEQHLSKGTKVAAFFPTKKKNQRLQRLPRSHAFSWNLSRQYWQFTGHKVSCLCQATKQRRQLSLSHFFSHLIDWRLSPRLQGLPEMLHRIGMGQSTGQAYNC